MSSSGRAPLQEWHLKGVASAREHCFLRPCAVLPGAYRSGKPWSGVSSRPFCLYARMTWRTKGKQISTQSIMLCAGWRARLAAVCQDDLMCREGGAGKSTVSDVHVQVSTRVRQQVMAGRKRSLHPR